MRWNWGQPEKKAINSEFQALNLCPPPIATVVSPAALVATVEDPTALVPVVAVAIAMQVSFLAERIAAI